MKLLLCVTNDGYPASLEPKKVYQSLEDGRASELGMVRVIDESGEDYLYGAHMFARVWVEPDAELELLELFTEAKLAHGWDAE